MLFQIVEISTDEVFSQRPKYVASNKTDMSVVVTGVLYFLSSVHISQQDVIDKDVTVSLSFRLFYPRGKSPIIH